MLPRPEAGLARSDGRVVARRAALALALALAGGATAGCGPSAADEARAAMEGTTDVVAESLYAMAFAPEGAASPDPADIAGAVARVAPARFRPAGCARAASAGATVTVTLERCVTPLDVVRSSGAFVGTFSRAGDGSLRVSVESSGLTEGGRAVDVRGAFAITRGVTSITLAGMSMSTRQGRAGAEVRRMAMYTIQFEPATRCVALDGAWSTVAPRRTASTTASGLRRCAERCLQAGGEIRHQATMPEESVTITFSGGSVARWQNARGEVGTVMMGCEP